MSYLPRVPENVKDDTLREYLVTLVREIGNELDTRPATQQGVLYLSGDRPITLISPNGTLYRLTVSDTGALETTEVPR